MLDVNNFIIELGDLVKIWNDKNAYLWKVEDKLDNGTVLITRANGHYTGIIEPGKLIWVDTPRKNLSEKE